MQHSLGEITNDKKVDWNLVASQLDISNGHAARMRYSRFRQHIEGIQAVPRAPRVKKSNTSKSEKGSAKADSKKLLADNEPLKEEDDPRISPFDTPFGTPFGTPSPSRFLKTENGEEPLLPFSMMPTLSSQPGSYPYITVAPSDLSLQLPPLGLCEPGPLTPQPMHHGTPRQVWAPVKLENDNGYGDDVWVKVEPRLDQPRLDLE